MQLTGAHTHVQPVGHLCHVRGLAAGAQVRAVLGGVLCSLQRPDLASRSMPVIDSNRGVRGELPVGAEQALGRVGGHGDHG